MFLSYAKTYDMLEQLELPCVLWAGDAIVRHSDGTTEIVHNVKVVPASRSVFGCRYAYKPVSAKRKGGLVQKACG